MTDKSEEMESEFGRGFAYCLGLFLAHAERDRGMTPNLWFYGAGDHIIDMIVPSGFKQAESFKHKVINFRFDMLDQEAAQEDKDWAIQTAKDLLLEWDKRCGIAAIKGSWE